MTPSEMNAYFTGKYGVVLMRRPASGSEWSLVRWLPAGVDVIADSPGAGSWVYEIWLVAGYGTGADVGISSEASITTLTMAR